MTDYQGTAKPAIKDVPWPDPNYRGGRPRKIKYGALLYLANHPGAVGILYRTDVRTNAHQMRYRLCHEWDHLLPPGRWEFKVVTDEDGSYSLTGCRVGKHKVLDLRKQPDER